MTARFLLVECLEAYANLNEAQKQRLQQLLATEPYKEVEPVMIATSYERGIVEGERRLALWQLEAKFGALSAEAKRRLEALPPQELRQMMLEFHKAQSLKELGLEE